MSCYYAELRIEQHLSGDERSFAYRAIIEHFKIAKLSDEEKKEILEAIVKSSKLGEMMIGWRTVQWVEVEENPYVIKFKMRINNVENHAPTIHWRP